MVQKPRWQDRTLHQPVFQEHGLHVLTGIANVNHWMAYWELKVFPHERVQRHYVYILYGLSVSVLIMMPHGFRSNLVQSIANVQRTVLYNGMCLQLGVIG